MGGSLNLPLLTVQVIILCSMIECGENPHRQIFQMRRNLTAPQHYPVADTNLWGSLENSDAKSESKLKISGTINRRQRLVKKMDAESISPENAFSNNNSDNKVSFSEVASAVSKRAIDNSGTEISSIYELPGIIVKQISFTQTLYVCEYLFSAMYGEYRSFPDSGIVYDNKPVIVIHSEKFLNVCTPLYDVFNACDKRDNMTFCQEENVLLLHHHECERHSPQDVHLEHLLAATLLEEDEECFQSVCHGSLRVVDTKVQGILVRLILAGDQTVNGSCHRFLQHYFRASTNDSIYATKNLQWSSYYPGYIVLWSEDPQEHGLFNNWSYLPEYCLGFEIFFTVIIAVIVLWGFVSNVTVVIIRLMMDVNEISNILQVSIATSDLLVNIAVLAPAFFGQAAAVSNLNGDTIEIQNDQEALTFFNSWQSSKRSTIDVNSGFYLFSALVMSICSINSIFVLLILSFERFAVFRGKPDHRKLFTAVRVKASVIVSWLLGLILSLIIMYGDNGITSTWNSFSKLPIGLTLTGHKALLYTVLALLGSVCMLTISFSSLSVYYSQRRIVNRDHQPNPAEEMEEKRKRQQNLQITLTLIMITALNISTLLSAGVAVVIQVLEIRFAYSDLVSYVCWWVFFTSTAWNPYLYNRKDAQFKEKFAAVLQNISHFAQLCFNTGQGVTDAEGSRESDQPRDEEDRSRGIIDTSTRNNVMVSSENPMPSQESGV